MNDHQSSSLNQIQNKSLKERIVEALREAILNGELRPGQQLIETELAAQLGVSRAPLREAIQIISTEGLVETVPYHGATVTRLTRVDIEELYSLRSTLESFALKRIIAEGDARKVLRLRELYDQMLEAADSDDITSVNEIDRVFHDTLIELSGHKLLMSTWNGVAMRVRQVMALRNRRNSDLKQIAHNHTPLLAAIEKGQLERALELIEEHVASAGDLLAEDWPDDDMEAG